MSNRVMLITGGSSGIRAATARVATADGYRVTGRDRARLQAIADNIGDTALGVVGDVADWTAQRSAVEQTLTRFGRLDVAFANAGFRTDGDLESGDPDAWREMIFATVLGVALTVKATLPALRASRGHLILSGSVAGRRATAGNLYGGTKWAITGLGESARQLNGTGVRVTVVQPGRVATPFWASSPPASLTAEDVAGAVPWALSQPLHVDFTELLLRPTNQDI